MNEEVVKDFSIKNADSSFTELFALLVRYSELPNSELNIIRSHIDNAILTILHGLQDMGQLIAVADKAKIRTVATDGIGDFISLSCNLIEALNGLGDDFAA
ncbi:MAG: hypothetical protein A3F13_08815 [Gammaproteobacteria bacterium RIFCSPHIGHO2_12_FULL_40_19]|nr:MAG: hypothetical protein A3F13_08815 [Gammaproteobacteria bacterium RIFCSPHIGHO2_12_FULL_40_19]